MDLSQNELTGLIPPELFELREMTTLVLSSNKIEGFVSNSINGMKSIGKIIYLYFLKCNPFTILQDSHLQNDIFDFHSHSTTE